jgi:hypothetical protein
VRFVVLVGVGDAQREVKGASWIARIDRVGTFGRAAVAFALLVTLGRKAQGHAVSPDRFALALQFHPSLALEDLYQVGLRLSRRRRSRFASSPPDYRHDVAQTHGAHD